MTEHSPAVVPPHGRAHAPVWLFGLLLIPYGMMGTFSSATLGKILKMHHASQATVTNAVFLSVLMAGIAFVYAPTVDIKLRRRTWFVIFCTTSALLLATGMFMLPSHIIACIVFTLAAQIAICLANAAMGGLMAATIPDELRGRASGFSNAGNIGAGAVLGGFTLQLIEQGTTHVPLLGTVSSFRLVGIVAGLLTVLPSLIVFFVDEPVRHTRGAADLFRTMGRDVWNTVKKRPGWSGILLCISPVGTAAAMQVFTSFSDNYHATPRMVTWVNGYVGGLLTGAACLLGGVICDRMNRRVAYLLSGALTAAIALVMAFSPMTPFTYAWAALTYLFITGFCYASFTAFVLQCVGGAQASASTQYTLFTSAGNFAIFYVGKFDGMGYDWYMARHGEALAPRGLLATDGALNLIGIALFLGLLALLKPEPAPKPIVPAPSG